MFFRSGSKPDYDKIIHALDFNKKDTATAARIPLESVRYDDRAPKDLEDRATEWATLLSLVAEHFNGDLHKTELWFKIPNPLLGNIAPRNMVRFGRFKKLLAFILNASNQDKRS